MRTRPRTLFAIILAMVGGGNLAYFLIQTEIEQPDTASYVVPGTRLFAGLGYTNAAHEPELIRTPLYPVLIGLFDVPGLGQRGLVLFQHALNVVVSALIFRFCMGRFRSPFIACCSALLFGLDPTVLHETNSVMSEGVFTFVAFLVFLEAHRLLHDRDASHRDLISLAILIGIAALIRPIGLALAGVSIVWIALLPLPASRRLRKGAIYLAALAVIPVGWAGYNAARTGAFVFSSVSTYDLLFYRAAGTLTLRTTGDYERNIGAIQAELLNGVDRELDRTYGKGRTPIGVRLSAYNRKGLEVVRGDLPAYARLCVRGILQTLLGGATSAMSALTGLPQSLVVKLTLLYTVPYLVLAVIGFGGFRVIDRKLFWLSLTFFAAMVLVPAGGGAYSRFRVPFMPVYAMSVSVGLVTLMAWLRRGAEAIGTLRQGLSRSG